MGKKKKKENEREREKRNKGYIQGTRPTMYLGQLKFVQKFANTKSITRNAFFLRCIVLPSSFFSIRIALNLRIAHDIAKFLREIAFTYPVNNDRRIRTYQYVN